MKGGHYTNDNGRIDSYKSLISFVSLGGERDIKWEIT